MYTLMDHLCDEYKKHLAEEAVELDENEKELLVDVVNWWKAYLSEINTPVNVAYLASGLGVKLAQGQLFAFCDDQNNQIMRDEGVPITGRNALGPSMARDTSVPVFGGK